MNNGNIINYYCFNKQCEQAIFFKTCVVKEVKLDTAINSVQYCPDCGSPMISKPMIRLEREVSSLMNNTTMQPSRNSIILNESILPQLSNRVVFQFNLSTQLSDINETIDYLVKNKNNEDMIPEFICVDREKAGADCWLFLEKLSNVVPSLKKEVTIYIISDHLYPEDYNEIKKYSAVRGFILKNHTVNFLYHSRTIQTS